jgi:flavin reductase (DIM6/NTAB) family NADH-FMN oxidoreductase RutF/uncharacterized protein GlcG (DUF336 family)
MDYMMAAMASATALARAHGASISVAVYDGSGRCLGSTRMDGTPWFVEEEARAIAFACASLGMGSRKIAELRGAPWLESILARRSDFGLGGAGAVVKRDGRVRAAAGVSGASDEIDELCAERAAASISEADADGEGVSNEAFRATMGALPAGVTVITTLDPATGEPRGMTANSVVSVSNAPPIVGILVGHSTQSYRAFAECKGFAVSILHAEQVQVALDLAKTGPEKFNGTPLKLSVSGYPVVQNSKAVFECRTQGGIDTDGVGRPRREGATGPRLLGRRAVRSVSGPRLKRIDLRLRGPTRT